MRLLSYLLCVLLVGCVTQGSELIYPDIEVFPLDSKPEDPGWLTMVTPTIDETELIKRDKLVAYVKFVVNTEGMAEQIEIESTNQGKKYNNELFKLIEKMRFIPGKSKGNYVNTPVKYEVRFTYK